jgi:hypothetical protein
MYIIIKTLYFSRQMVWGLAQMFRVVLNWRAKGRMFQPQQWNPVNFLLWLAVDKVYQPLFFILLILFIYYFFWVVAFAALFRALLHNRNTFLVSVLMCCLCVHRLNCLCIHRLHNCCMLFLC